MIRGYTVNGFLPMKRVEKGWGYEIWIVNKPEYCGKLLYFNEGKRCSWHHHKIKDEVLFNQSRHYDFARRFCSSADKSDTALPLD